MHYNIKVRTVAPITTVVLDSDYIPLVTGGGVYPHVAVQIARLGKPEAAKAALVGFLARVNPQVLRQRARVGEGLLALSTPATFRQHTLTVDHPNTRPFQCITYLHTRARVFAMQIPGSII